MISGNYDVRPIDAWVRIFAVVPLVGSADDDGAIVRQGKSASRGDRYWYCDRCADTTCPHALAIESLGYKLEEL